MSVRQLFERILAMDTYLHSKKLPGTREKLTKWYGENFLGETSDGWLLRALHRTNPPATAEQIREAEEQLGFRIPEQYEEFLLVSNGARLFATPPARYKGDPADWAYCYWLFSTDELVYWNQWLFDQFRDLLGDDPDFCDVFRLNYLAFCDVRDGNYNAFLIDPPQPEFIFFLHHDYCYRPYSEEDSDLYFTVAHSFEEWLQQIIDGGGLGPGRYSRGLWEAPEWPSE